MLKGTSATLAGAAAVKTTTRDASLTAKVRKLIFIILSPALPAFTYRQTPAAVKLGSAESFGRISSLSLWPIYLIYWLYPDCAQIVHCFVYTIKILMDTLVRRNAPSHAHEADS